MKRFEGEFAVFNSVDQSVVLTTYRQRRNSDRARTNKCASSKEEVIERDKEVDSCA